MSMKKEKSLLEKIEKKTKQRVYKWHRFFAMITLVPVVLWCLSGIMHPFMAHFFKPEIKKEFVEPKVVDSVKVTFSIQEILKVNKIDTFKNFRLVEMDGNWFYQVKWSNEKIDYFDASTTKKINNGDVIYAHWLARYFLDDHQSKIVKTTLLTQFDSQYKYINRYLPVYKVVFDRPDKMQVYVETGSSKLATFNPVSRQAFIWFFDTFHNWSFLDAIATNSVRIVILTVLLGIILLSAISGLLIYGFFWKQFKKIQPNHTNNKRISHRKYGLAFSIFCIGFAFSGVYHLTKKWNPVPLQEMVYQPDLKMDKIKLSNQNIAVDQKKLLNISLIQFQDSVYYRCELKADETEHAPLAEEKWKKKVAPVADVVYINAATNVLDKEMDFKYAKFLANYFDGGNSTASCCESDSFSEEKKCSIKAAPLLETKVLTEFDNREYGFVNKRLPVVKLAYDTPEETTYFVATDASRIAAVVKNSDRAEGYSFAFFHKFLWMDWAGKTIRDLVMTLAAIGLFISAILGMRLLFKK
ncbi:PepSY domain-containing protein [Flavobacterium hankyongi]|uniref:PepSY domain-containing protein n=2 Tax=Flavobacteriaceae TaxID=49546 RepID=A0ABP8ZU44_9FLAO